VAHLVPVAATGTNDTLYSTDQAVPVSPTGINSAIYPIPEVVSRAVLAL
jgi:hypothetical protein